MKERIVYQISEALDLGAIIEPPRRLSGGFLHSMYSLFSQKGAYAVKLLNPYIMQRPSAMENFRRAETLEERLEQNGVSILPALNFGGRKMQRIGDQFFYVFDWFDGGALRSCDVREEHCRTIAEQLARIHAIDRRECHFGYEGEIVDWEALAKALSEKNPDLGALLTRNVEVFQSAQALAGPAFEQLEQTAVICHNDMDCKNVLWKDGECRIIDLECLDWGSGAVEVYETALCWSGIEQCDVNPRLFEAFIRAYENAGGVIPSSWKCVHDANCGRLGWLAYNVRRALGVDCSVEDVVIGENEVRKTVRQLIHYQEIRERLL